ncbi:MAG: hypothetical protein ACOY99_01430 [Pseudomonadota bacterium]|jgi:hypothetical protein
MADFAGPAYPLPLGGDLYRFFITGRGADNRSRIGSVDILWAAPPRIVGASGPHVDVGALGCFDGDGAAYPWVVAHQGRLYLYYAGWIRGGSVAMHHGIGLAIADSPDGPFKKYSRAPLLPRSDAEPIGSASCCVVRESDGGWRMAYTSFVRWEETPQGPKHYYNIRITRSADGIRWDPASSLAIDFAGPHEYAIGKPCLVEEKGRQALYFVARGARYQIWRAVHDGARYVRDDAPLPLPASDWDSEMQAYPVVFSHRGQRILLYNGNGYGRTGLGYAVEADA